MTESHSQLSKLPWIAGSLVALTCVILGGLYFAGYFRTTKPEPKYIEPGTAQERQEVEVPSVKFTDVTSSWGINFVHHSGAQGKKLLPETMGSGVAVFDFNGDGKPDLLFVNSCPWPTGRNSSQPTSKLTLYRNEGQGRFVDVSSDVGLDISLYGMGATVGDFDNDGRPDLFITAVGGNRLFRNEDGKRFRDVTSRAGVAGAGGWPGEPEDFFSHQKPIAWSSSATFVDYDGDGLLDLFVCNYVTWSPGIDLKQTFTLTGKERSYGPPVAFEGAQCKLYRNRGAGRFEDVSSTAGIEVFQSVGLGKDKKLFNVGKSLGVIVCDLDDDGWPDLVVANDTVRNFLFHNVPDDKGGRKYEEIGTESGIAYAEGNARGAMGIDWAPGYRKGMGALLIGNFADEPNTFLVREPSGVLFTDRALAEGISGPSRSLLKFGTMFFDYDLDGRLDFLTCNGHLEPDISVLQRGQTYAQPPQLFWNTGLTPRGFEPVTEKAVGKDLFKPIVGRGCAYGDLDGDGDLDVVLTANGGSPRILRNEGGTTHHWVRLRLVGDGKRSNTSAIGARVTLEADGEVQKREVVASRGYLSASELTLTFGLGKKSKITKVTIHWPGAKAKEPQVLTNVAIDKEHVIKQGE